MNPVAGKSFGQCFQPAFRPAGNDDPGPGFQETKADSLCRTTCPQEKNSFSLQIKLLGQGPVCPDPVGIHAMDFFIFGKDQRIDRADFFSHRIDGIDMFQNRFLVRNSDRESTHTQSPATGQGFCCICCREGHINLV